MELLKVFFLVADGANGMEGVIVGQPAPQPNWSTLTLRIVQTACTVLSVTGTMSAYFRTLTSSFFFSLVGVSTPCFYLSFRLLLRASVHQPLRVVPRWLFIAFRLRCHHTTSFFF